ncbi:MAG: TrmH family RNA methyltransferase [Clostridia bacterium]
MLQDIFVRNVTFQRLETIKRNRQKRRQEGAFLVEGVRPINLARLHGWVFEALLYARNAVLSDWAQELLAGSLAPLHYALAPELMAELSEKEDTSELLAVVRMREPSFSVLTPSAQSLIVVFDRPQNPGNLGTVIRSCSSFRADGLCLTGHSADPWDPACIRASIGTVFSMPIFQLSGQQALQPLLAQYQDAQYPLQVIGTSAHGDQMLDAVDFTKPTMLLIGNETEGLTRGYKAACDLLARIPIFGDASSLNVGCATSICLYEINRQRGVTA